MRSIELANPEKSREGIVQLQNQEDRAGKQPRAYKQRDRDDLGVLTRSRPGVDAKTGSREINWANDFGVAERVKSLACKYRVAGWSIASEDNALGRNRRQAEASRTQCAAAKLQEYCFGPSQPKRRHDHEIRKMDFHRRPFDVRHNGDLSGHHRS
ncbi:hypothetical protein ACVME8_001021 [Bradyrhizobium diazoefficiens]